MVATAERPAPKIRQPLSRKGSVILTLSIMGLLFVLYLLHKVDWTEPPVYSGAILLSTTYSETHNIKQTSYISDGFIRAIKLNIPSDLRERGWWNGTQNLDRPSFILYDESKTVTIIDLHFFHTECPAYYLSVSYESATNNSTLITYTETVGPCGNKFK